jgi:NADH dehydrogenase
MGKELGLASDSRRLPNRATNRIKTLMALSGNIRSAVMKPRQRVVIVGGGFGGLNAAQSLKRLPVDITLVDRRNFHLFQPLLYQVATGGLSPANIAAPLRAILKHQKNVEVWLDEAVDIDVAGRRLILCAGKLDYDTLILAAGASHHYFGHPEWEGWAPGLKDIEDATDIRRRILLAFEGAEREPNPDAVAAWLTFVIVGGGPTGVELAGALGELAHHTLRDNFRHIDPSRARIVLLEGLERILSTYPESLSRKATAALERLGVTVQTGSLVTDIRADRLVYRHRDAAQEMPARTVLWAAGVQASPLARVLEKQASAVLDRAGRLKVEANLTIPGHAEIFVIGDMAHCPGPAEIPLPGVAQVAIQQGRYVARVIRERFEGKPSPPFRYYDLGNMATIGRHAAVADFGWLRFSGYLAWLAWLFIHLINLIGFENRLLVLTQWAWYYLTRNRSARLITGKVLQPDNRT